MNGACEGSPALIVLPESDSDVSLALRAATSAGLSVSVRGGGHRSEYFQLYVTALTVRF